MTDAPEITTVTVELTITVKLPAGEQHQALIAIAEQLGKAQDLPGVTAFTLLRSSSGNTILTDKIKDALNSGHLTDTDELAESSPRALARLGLDADDVRIVVMYLHERGRRLQPNGCH